jgi:putative PIN family toxin of toxin-antitoxin system
MVRKRNVRIVIDTNLWISFLITKSFQKLDSIVVHHNPKICFSDELLQELTNSVSKPRLSKHFGPTAIEEMIFAFSDYIQVVEVKSKINVCRDPNDNFLLALCKDGFADFLLTGDKDLLDLERFGKTKIMTISDFVNQTQ